MSIPIANGLWLPTATTSGLTDGAVVSKWIVVEVTKRSFLRREGRRVGRRRRCSTRILGAARLMARGTASRTLLSWLRRCRIGGTSDDVGARHIRHRGRWRCYFSTMDLNIAIIAHSDGENWGQWRLVGGNRHVAGWQQKIQLSGIEQLSDACAALATKDASTFAAVLLNRIQRVRT